MNPIQALRAADAQADAEFQPFEEEIIVSLAFDIPDYFIAISQLLHPDLFHRPHTKYIINELLNCVQQYSTIPTRTLFGEMVDRQLTVDHPYHYEIAELIARPASYRDLPVVKARLDDWAKQKQISKLYGPEGREAYKRGDVAALIEIVEGVHKLNQVQYSAFSLYEQFDELCRPDAVEHMTTGFKGLDKNMRKGGPAPGDVLIYMGPTNIGKSIFLCNSAVAHTRRSYDTLLISFEMDTLSLAARCVGIITNKSHELEDIRASALSIKPVIQKEYASHKAKLQIVVLPADECSIVTVDNIIENFRRTQGWTPKSIILDYMDLMVSMRDSDNQSDYSRQKYIAYQLKQLGQKRHALITSATQTNRSGDTMTDGPIDLTKAAESYGKAFPVDYVLTINRTNHDNKLDLYFAKNRFGHRDKRVTVDINYNSMLAKEAF